MPYRAPVTEFRFLFDHVTGFGRLARTDRFADATSRPWPIPNALSLIHI